MMLKINVNLKGLRKFLSTGVSSKQIYDGQWHHECATWNGAGGAVNLYIDGVNEQTGKADDYKSFNEDAGFVIGQDQDSPGGGFEERQSFAGEVTQFNVWDYPLDPHVISGMAASRCDEPIVGNYLGWPEFRFHIRGNVQIKPLGCPVVEGNAPVIYLFVYLFIFVCLFVCLFVYVLMFPCDRSLLAQPISTRKAQSRKKPTNLCAPREFLKKFLPCHN